MSSQPPPGFIHIFLLRQENRFYLEIPIAIAAMLCLSPLKYLQHLGWCVLGIIGDVADKQGSVIPLDGELVDQGVYHYIVPDQNVLAHAVDPEIIKERSQISDETTEFPEDFTANLLERDGCCASIRHHSLIPLHPKRLFVHSPVSRLWSLPWDRR